MNQDILNTIILSTAFLALFATAELLFHKFNVNVELTRKLVHIGTGLLSLLFPILLNNQWLVLFLCASFACILILSLKFNFLKSINAIDRESVGSLAYPVSVYCCYLVFDYFNRAYIYFYLPILILAICDPVAALMGKKWPVGKFRVGKGNKTLMGSGMFFLTAFTIVILFSLLSAGETTIPKLLLEAALVACISCTSEALSGKGYDNLTIPASVLLSLILIPHLF